MKELYISPELEILCFAPAEALMSVYGNSYNVYGGAKATTDAGMSTGDELPGDVIETQPEGDMDPLN